MDQETRELLVRIDERTHNTDNKVQALLDRFAEHEKQDRADFGEVFARIAAVEKRQNWFAGAWSVAVLGVGAVIAWFLGAGGGGGNGAS